MFLFGKKKDVKKTTKDENLLSAERARDKVFNLRRKLRAEEERYRFGKMSVKEAIQHRIDLHEFDCTVEVSGAEYDNLKHLCLRHGYNIKLSVMQGTGESAQITARITW